MKSLEDIIHEWEEKEFGNYKCDCVPATKEQVKRLADNISKECSEEIVQIHARELRGQVILDAHKSQDYNIAFMDACLRILDYFEREIK